MSTRQLSQPCSSLCTDELMAKRNYLVEGGSGTGKSSVCRELRRRGYKAIDGDNELAYQGDPETGERTEGVSHENHIWNVGKVREIASNTEDEVIFFCGGSRNFNVFLDLFDKVFVLDVDTETLEQRLDSRTVDDWGAAETERELILRLHATKGDLPEGMIIDTARPLNEVVDAIVECIEGAP
jgi:broad-specificity NMP kinase